MDVLELSGYSYIVFLCDSLVVVLGCAFGRSDFQKFPFWVSARHYCWSGFSATSLDADWPV